MFTWRNPLISLIFSHLFQINEEEKKSFVESDNPHFPAKEICTQKPQKIQFDSTQNSMIKWLSKVPQNYIIIFGAPLEHSFAVPKGKRMTAKGLKLFYGHT